MGMSKWELWEIHGIVRKNEGLWESSGIVGNLENYGRAQNVTHWQSVCLACGRSWIHPSVLQEWEQWNKLWESENYKTRELWGGEWELCKRMRNTESKCIIVNERRIVWNNGYSKRT